VPASFTRRPLTLDTDASRYAFKPGRFSSHGRILRLAAEWPRSYRILELGTASGYLGRELRDRGFTDLFGVEGDPVAADAARQYYRSLLIADLEHPAWPADFHDFDVLICADVLEHLRRPDIQLRHLTTLMRPGGLIVISLPNVANWMVRLSLLGGHFTYRDRGLLDRGHLRFFTYRTAQRLIQGAVGAIEQCDSTSIPLAYLLAPFVPAVLARAAERVYAAFAVTWKTLFAYQFVFVARVGGHQPPARTDF
jgi:2-polyprenyl-3-methyl-5-hydroxy-6-metoxy-1,4-benzoquinol methylase